MKNQQKQILTGTHGHMVKTKRQIIEDLKLIDIVVEILDARIPISSQNPDIGNYIKEKTRIIMALELKVVNMKSKIKNGLTILTIRE